jgi:histidinol dehydrogenase
MERRFRTKILCLTSRNVCETAKYLREKVALEPSVRRVAEKIVLDVRKHGDSALRRWSQRLDGTRPLRFAASKREIHVASARVPSEEIRALRFVAEQLRGQTVLDLKMTRPFTSVRSGVRTSRVFQPFDSVGCYVPGGRVAYPSSLLMSAVLAKTAGVTRTVVCSPPLPDGTLNPLVAAAAELCEVDEIYKAGGAQAIAAMAYGTASIEPVDKIVGPGGPYVLAAKQIVSNDVAIDLPAGPTELLVVAFGKFDENFVARDLVAQAEHSPWGICGVVTDSTSNARAVISTLSRILSEGAGREIARKALERSFFVCIARSLRDAAEFANVFAPEHVQLMGSAREIAGDVKNCGLLLVGDYSPSAVSDYSAGSNHILPTGGLARSYSGLSVWDFMRRTEIVSCSRKGLRNIAQPAIVLARAEGLENHARAVLERLKD